jgi:hypothetical protein
MHTNRFTRWAFAAGLPLTGLAAVALADQAPKGKSRIEAPTKEVVANTAPATPPPPTKREVELPTKDTVAKSVPTATDNPTVEAGPVKWHPTLDDAQAAAKKSGKPVLLFQMMGHLDKKFC